MQRGFGEYMGTRIHYGTICVDTRCCAREGNAYRVIPTDLPVDTDSPIDFFIRTDMLSYPVQGCMEASYRRSGSETCEPGERCQVLLPVSVGRRTHREFQHYDVNLLVPPETVGNPILLSTGMVVPMLRVRHRLEGKKKGFILASEYTGALQFYTGEYSRLMESVSKNGVEFQGIIWDIPGGKRRPVVRIFTNSVSDPAVFEQNREMLEELRRKMASGARFWWDLDIAKTWAEDGTGEFD